MKLINESVWGFKSVKWSAYVTILMSVTLLVLQNALDLKLLPEPYDNIASMIIVLLTAIAGKKVYQPELHKPDINNFAIQPLVSMPPQKPGFLDLDWMVEAKKHIGLRENTSKTAHNPTILSWLKSLKAWWAEDETPWCGVFVAHCLKVAGVTYPKHWYRALGYLEAGSKLAKPAYGCVAVKTRKGGGHVCFVAGITPGGKLVCVGGNQNNMVSYALYDVKDFEEFRWYGKTNRPAEHRYTLPVISSVSATKVTEA
ncbi:NlpC/P60 family protein [Acinetobacter colistiniresistens]|uniref:NlpC/P60 family protein n=1 Tax=Acinetobacter colistiniresistens TaxID=280145 RepID=UPI00124F9611|nr:TIGR02594 family protein [Acinetobacter colistiniresistens]